MSAELVREATRDGRTVARLRCYDIVGGTIIEADVLRTGTEETVKRGPYRFENASEAFRFLQEAMLSFEYLGCTVG